LTDDYFCKIHLSCNSSNNRRMDWVTGVANDGIIEVTTTTFGTGFKHTVVLKK
jgi:hypothetical protein